MTDISIIPEEASLIDADQNQAVPMIEGIAHNGRMVDVAFPFYLGAAGLRDRGDGVVEFAFFRQSPFRLWRETLVEGYISGDHYRVTGSKVSTTTKAMIIVTAQKI